MKTGLGCIAMICVVSCVVALGVGFAVAGRAGTKAAPFVAQGKASAPEQLRPLLEELDAAANARDTDRFMALYLRQPALLWVINGEEIHGWDDLRAQQLKWWSGGKSDVVYSDRSAPEFTVLSPDAVIVTEMKAATRTLPDGTTGKREFAVSMVWQKLPEGWRIVYGHESFASSAAR
jgi:ketosteroid isomerase-like protein